MLNAQDRSELLPFTCQRDFPQRPRQPVYIVRRDDTDRRIRLDAKFFRRWKAGR